MGRAKKVVNVDFDGVIYDFTDAMREAFDYRFGQAMLERGEPVPLSWPDPTEWAVWESWPIDRTAFYEVLYAEVLDGLMFRTGNLIDGAREGMTRLYQAGWHVRIVTAKTFNDARVTRQARLNTIRFLDEQDIPHHTLVFSDSHGKLDFRAHMVIDDKPDLTRWVQIGAANVLFDQPWNKKLSTIPDFYEAPGWFSRGFGWGDVVEQSKGFADQGVLL